jgi:pimeloyl-ACP methyl ester carboxylesterase
MGLLNEKIGLPKTSVVLATSFTTASVTEGVLGMAQRARTQPVPALVAPWTVEKPIEPDGRIRFRASIDVPDYRSATDGLWHLDGAAPKEQKRVTLELFLAFSNGNQSGKRPVVIYQHGLGGDKDGTWGTTERLAELGCAVVGIDSPEHGSRAPGGSKDPIVAISGFLGVDLAAKSFDVAKAGDNFRQMASDQLELVRFLGSLGQLDLLPEGAPDGVPDLDVSQVLYIGHSFGSVQGATIFAIAPELTHAVWNVGGAGLTVLLRDSPLFGLVLKGLRPPGTPDGSLGRFFAMIQAIVDPGDAANYARFAANEAPPGITGWKPRDVLLQESVPDGIVPNSSAEVLARGLGLVNQNAIARVSGLPGQTGAITGNLAGGATGVLAQFDRMNGDTPATHGELIFSAEAKKQYVAFFASGLATGHSTVQPAYP